MSSLNATTTDNLRPFPLRIPLKDVPALDDDELSIDASLDSPTVSDPESWPSLFHSYEETVTAPPLKFAINAPEPEGEDINQIVVAAERKRRLTQ